MPQAIENDVHSHSGWDHSHAGGGGGGGVRNRRMDEPPPDAMSDAVPQEFVDLHVNPSYKSPPTKSETNRLFLFTSLDSLLPLPLACHVVMLVLVMMLLTARSLTGPRCRLTRMSFTIICITTNISLLTLRLL